MPDPISLAGGSGPISSVPPASPQIQARVAADTVGTSTTVESTGSAGTTGARGARQPIGQAQQAANRQGQAESARETRDAQEAAAARPAFSSEEVEEAVETFREYLSKLPSDLNFNYDKDAGRHFFKVVNPVTREVVKQFPTDEFLSMVKRLRDTAPAPAKNGVILDDKF